MKTISILKRLLGYSAIVFLGLAAAARAQNPVTGTEYTTRINVWYDIGIGFVPPQFMNGTRVLVHPGDYVVLDMPYRPRDAVQNLQWTKNGKPIEGATSNSLIFPAVSAEDAGDYLVTGLAIPLVAMNVHLEVGEVGHVGNFSSRAELIGGAAQISGYSVAGNSPKTFLVRAVGPSLRGFGIASPVAQPAFAIYTANGTQLSFAHTMNLLPEHFWEDAFAKAGAFQLTGGETPFEAFDIVTLLPGTYTVHAWDKSGAGGTVLLEFYEYPGQFPETIYKTGP